MRVEQIIDAAIEGYSQINHLNKMLEKHLRIDFVYILTKTFFEFLLKYQELFLSVWIP